MTPRRHRHLTAWLGMFAMWLIVLVPLVSQLQASARTNAYEASTLCSTVDASTTSMHRSMADPLAACGYCDLLADHLPVPGMPPALPPFVMLLIGVAIPVLSTRFTPTGAFHSGRPRAPPFSFI